MRWASASSTPASPNRTWSPSRRGWPARACGPGSTASRRFVYARPFEQIRNDVCLHDLPVVLVGNGGGYGYGVMGARTMPSKTTARCCACRTCGRFVPAFDGDVAAMVAALVCQSPPGLSAAGPVRRARRDGRRRPMRHGANFSTAAGRRCWSSGPLVGRILDAVRETGRSAAAQHLAGVGIAVAPICPQEFLADLARSQRLVVVEEHVAHGGAGQMLASAPADGRAVRPRRFTHRTAPWAIRRGSTARRSSIGRNAASIADIGAAQSARGARARMMALDIARQRRLEAKNQKLQGPILVLGGSGFVGANLLRTLLAVPHGRGRHHHAPAGLAAGGLARRERQQVDLLVDSNLDALLDEVRPAHDFQLRGLRRLFVRNRQQLDLPDQFQLHVAAARRAWRAARIACYIHAGSSSEYGDNAAGAAGDRSDRAEQRIRRLESRRRESAHFYGKRKKFPCCNLRLYSVYGPLEDSSRLIPNVIRQGIEGDYPEFVDPDISRDFVYVDDVTEAFVDAALNLREEDYGESFNIGTGQKTTIGEVAATGPAASSACRAMPPFTMPRAPRGT